MAIHSSVLAGKIPWAEEPGRLQSMGSQRVGHHPATEHSVYISGLLPQFVPLSPSPAVSVSVLYICVSIPSLQIGSSVPFFLDSISVC